uniref:Uncharacterized protein n=1 Tax=Alexandrium andersonii TaxID=327968 RepID=A0A7S2G7D4_9DINO
MIAEEDLEAEAAPATRSSRVVQAGGSLRAELEALRAELTPAVKAQAELVRSLQEQQQALVQQVEDCKSTATRDIEGAQNGVQGALQGLHQLSGAVRVLGKQVRGEAGDDLDVTTPLPDTLLLTPDTAPWEPASTCRRRDILSDLEIRLQGLGQRVSAVGNDPEPAPVARSRPHAESC